MKEFLDYYERYVPKFLSRKTIRVMKMTVVLSMLTVVQLWAIGSYSQTAKVTLKLDNVTISNALSAIENQSGYYFLYSPKLIDVDSKVTVNAEDEPVNKVLAEIFSDGNVQYKVYDNQIVLMPKESEPTNDSNQQNGKQITGVVTDIAGKSLPGVNVVVKGTTTGTITDLDGKYVLENIPPDATLVFSFVGMKTEEVAVNGKSIIDIEMQEETVGIEEVVAIGYGTIKKSDLTGSIASVTNKQFKSQPVKRIEDILQGRTPGVEVTTLSGMPGDNIKVRIRGTTSINKSSDPLYVIDGIFSSSGLEGINPSDIQSIEVLKDASATAMYGSRGANGVILVTTRRGEEGQIFVTAEANVGISNMMKKYDLLNAYEYANALNEIKGSSTISAADLEAYKNGTKGIDWQDVMTQTGVSQDYKLSISGGNSKNRYFVSGDMLDMSAITITTKFKRYNLRTNIDSKVSKWLTFSAGLNAAKLQTHNGNVDLMDALNYSPTMEMKDPTTGVYNMDPYNSISYNPYGALKVNYNDSYRYYLNSDVTLLFRIIDGLTFSVKGGYNYSNQPYYSFTSSLSQPGQISGMENRSEMNNYWQNTNNLTYHKTFGDHSITATAVWEESHFQTTYLTATGSNLSNEIVGYWNIQNAATRDVSNGFSEESILSGIGRVMYNYKERYFLTGTFRADGSSKFQGKNKWGYFPSGAIAWNIAKEGFMKDQDIFQQMKLRGSFGITGNQDIERYSTLGMLSTASYGWGNSTAYTGYWGNSFATPDVRWEKTYQYDLGLDFSILNSRVHFTTDWFQKQTKDLLFLKTVPGYNGGGSFWVNQGKLKNSGIEFSVNASPILTNDLTWETTFNASYVKNNVVDLAGEDFILDATYSNFGGSMQIMKPGYPLGAFYLYKWRGFDDHGANLYKKADGSLTTSPTSADQFIMGQSNPKWTIGWNNTINWKNWTASIFFYAATGFDRLDLTRFGLCSMVGMYRFISLREAYFKGWDHVSDKADAKYPSYTNSDTKYYGNSDLWLENASFLKLKNISIAYRVPKHITKSTDIQFSVSAQNLFTITKYKGMDPEVYNNFSGLDIGAYPVPRTFTFGAKLNF